MHNSVKMLLIVLGVGLIVVGAESLLLVSRHAVSSPQAVHTVDEFDWNKQRNGWSAYMDSVGQQAAYDMLKESYRHETFMVQHTAIHLFGALFYEKYGLKGIRYCDNSFAFGCFHSFFASATSKEGDNILGDLERECNDLSDRVDIFSCQHGIGHSLLAHGQMSDNELIDALTLCDTLSHKEPISGCKSGVFMEYNFRSMASIEKAGNMMMRLFEKKLPYAPCSWLSDAFLEACYFAQTQWWDNVLDHDYAAMGHLCAAITNETYRLSCFMGIGNVASEYVIYNVPSVVEICSKMPLEQGRNECLINASWTFSNDSRLRGKASEVCKEADEAVRARCYHAGSEKLSF
ncbi:MAG: hypothetical protein Q8R40_01690 [bacterium]|nr:hypothetical protein [bacterium]